MEQDGVDDFGGLISGACGMQGHHGEEEARQGQGEVMQLQPQVTLTEIFKLVLRKATLFTLMYYCNVCRYLNKLAMGLIQVLLQPENVACPSTSDFPLGAIPKAVEQSKMPSIIVPDQGTTTSQLGICKFN